MDLPRRRPMVTKDCRLPADSFFSHAVEDALAPLLSLVGIPQARPALAEKAEIAWAAEVHIAGCHKTWQHIQHNARSPSKVIVYDR